MSARDVKRRVGAPARRTIDRVTRAIFERGTYEDTSGRIYLDELGLEAPGRNAYEPSVWTFLPRALRGERIGPEHVFIDLGSGMGRVVCQAAQRPFGRVIGVELSEQLTAVARRNVERNRDRFRCPDVKLVVSDILDYELSDDVTHVYWYHSFSDEVLTGALAKVTESLDRRPRPMTLMYANPVLASAVLASGRFRLRRRSRGIRRDLLEREVAIFESV